MRPSRSFLGRALALLVLFGSLALVAVGRSAASYTAAVAETAAFTTDTEQYGCGLGYTVVASVQNGTATIGGGGSPAGPTTLVTTATVTAVDPAKSFLTFSVASPGNGSNPGAIEVRGELTNATTITFTRETSEASPVAMSIGWTVVEYACGVSVQRGSQFVNSLTTNVTIASVATGSSFVMWSKTAKSTDTGWNADDTAIVSLTSATNLRITTAQGPTGHVVNWQVVEYTAGGAAVERGTTAAFNDTSTLSTTVTLGAAAALTSSFVLVDPLHNNGAGADAPRLVTGRLSAPTSLVLERSSASSAVMSVGWQVITLFDGSFVQAGTMTAAGTASTATWNAIDASRSSVMGSTQIGAGQGIGRTTGSVSAAQARLSTTASTITASRSSTASGATIEVSRIEWGGPATTWNSGYGVRRRIVTTATNSGGTASGYSLSVSFDHAAAVASGPAWRRATTCESPTSTAPGGASSIEYSTPAPDGT